jgi:NAD(P)H-hydrate epimerase
MTTPFTLTREQVRELDRRAINDFGVSGIVLMENAGRGCAELLMRLNPARKPTVILCGPGNNGGDGFVIARHLDNHGWPVTAWLIADPTVLAGDAEVNYRVARDTGLVGTTASVLEGWVVDALFGTGLSRGIERPLSDYVAAMNASNCPVLAIDIPSGLDCDTGEPLGPTVRATHTATFVAPKHGFLNPKSREWTGEVHVIDIGAPRVLVEEYRNRPTA